MLLKTQFAEQFVTVTWCNVKVLVRSCKQEFSVHTAIYICRNNRIYVCEDVREFPQYFRHIYFHCVIFHHYNLDLLFLLLRALLQGRFFIR